MKAPRGDAFGRKDIGKYDHGQAGSPYMATVESRTTGWKPSCKCNARTVPGTVLDPFAGSGTTSSSPRSLGATLSSSNSILNIVRWPKNVYQIIAYGVYGQ